MGRRSYWWSEERRALLAELWPAGVPVDEVCARLHLLPGWMLDPPRVAAEAGRLDLRRPDGFRSAVAKTSALGRQRGWTELLEGRVTRCPMLTENDILDIQLRNKHNEDVLFLLKELWRIQQSPVRSYLDLEPHRLCDLEIRQKGNDDFLDLMAELRRRGALRR
jgi:hypothetical protein